MSAGPSPLASVLRVARIAGGIAWEAPQSALGALNLAYALATGSVARIVRENGRIFVELRVSRAISLGHFVFWTTIDSAIVRVNPDNKLHEYGHALQSRLLGPLYLPIVGIPSSLRVVYAAAQHVFTKRPWDGYYAGFPERWADRLGGVQPDARRRGRPSDSPAGPHPPSPPPPLPPHRAQG